MMSKEQTKIKYECSECGVNRHKEDILFVGAGLIIFFFIAYFLLSYAYGITTAINASCNKGNQSACAFQANAIRTLNYSDTKLIP